MEARRAERFMSGIARLVNGHYSRTCGAIQKNIGHLEVEFSQRVERAKSSFGCRFSIRRDILRASFYAFV